jgi:hypothetical protein
MRRRLKMPRVFRWPLRQALAQRYQWLRERETSAQLGWGDWDRHCTLSNVR